MTGACGRYGPGMRRFAEVPIQYVADGWLVPVQTGRDNTMFTIDAKTHLVTSILSSSGAIRVGGDVQTLPSVPALPQSEPRC